MSDSLCSIGLADYASLVNVLPSNTSHAADSPTAPPPTPYVLTNNNDPQYEIPRQAFIIWKSRSLGKYALQYHQNWLKNEPGLNIRLILDDECRSLAAQYPNRTGLLQVYDNFPLNVMRADTCRLLVIYYYGGIYMDLDVNWRRKLDEWFMFNASSRIQFGYETSNHYCNWFFGATKYHPCLALVLDLIAEKGRNINTTYEHFVHMTTGPAVFTEGLERCGARPVFGRKDMAVTNIQHIFGSISWKNVDKTYSSWTDARDAEVQKAKMEAEKKGDEKERRKDNKAALSGKLLNK